MLHVRRPDEILMGFPEGFYLRARRISCLGKKRKPTAFEKIQFWCFSLPWNTGIADKADCLQSLKGQKHLCPMFIYHAGTPGKLDNGEKAVGVHKPKRPDCPLSQAQSTST